MQAEQQMVWAVEEWRKEMKLENMILLGHSMGGFLAASYAISYPNRYNDCHMRNKKRVFIVTVTLTAVKNLT